MEALDMQVKGFQFQGKIYIALDEGSDYYQQDITLHRATRRYKQATYCNAYKSYATSCESILLHEDTTFRVIFDLQVFE